MGFWPSETRNESPNGVLRQAAVAILQQHSGLRNQKLSSRPSRVSAGAAHDADALNESTTNVKPALQALENLKGNTVYRLYQCTLKTEFFLKHWPTIYFFKHTNTP